jgi:hypothetical protein
MKVGFGLQLCQQIMPPFAILQVQIAPLPTSSPFNEWSSVVSLPPTRSKDHGRLRLKSPIRTDPVMLPADAQGILCMPSQRTLS